jgi:hypothetical protein
MARAIDVLREDVRVSQPRLTLEVSANGGDVSVSFARVDLAQHIVEP